MSGKIFELVFREKYEELNMTSYIVLLQQYLNIFTSCLTEQFHVSPTVKIYAASFVNKNYGCCKKTIFVVSDAQTLVLTLRFFY